MKNVTISGNSDSLSYDMFNYKIYDSEGMTLEDWEAGRRTPPEYIPKLIAYQLMYEGLKKAQRI